jgi:hypothetical protein
LWEPPAPELAPEPEGVDRLDAVWRVPWLKGLRRVPKDATWPRFMTVPHPNAVGSLGAEFIAWAEKRSGRPLRWWQKLVATRLLEVDAKGGLVWETVILSTARQVGKSWGMREICLWRIEQGSRFGEPQDVMHTGKDLAICKEIQRPARLWAKARPEIYKVREVNGQEEIEYLADGSRWMLRAKEAVYGYGVSVAFVDEAWKVKTSSVDEGLVPTMAERVQPQLWLVSTAHRLATTLMLRRREVALKQLRAGVGDLLIEWSAPASAALDDLEGWRMASPHWNDRRERLIRRQHDGLLAGEIEDPEEPDPEQSFRAQWLNQWPRQVAQDAASEALLPAGLWETLADSDCVSTGPVYVAVEDHFGRGAAIAAACPLDDGRIEVDGWSCEDWDQAVEDVQQLAEYRHVRQLLVGASLLDRVPPGTVPQPEPAGSRETRTGLALFRDLAATASLTHNSDTAELADAVRTCQVKEGLAGLALAGGGKPHLVKAAVWAVQAAHKPAPVPSIR